MSSASDSLPATARRQREAPRSLPAEDDIDATFAATATRSTAAPATITPASSPPPTRQVVREDDDDDAELSIEEDLLGEEEDDDDLTTSYTYKRTEKTTTVVSTSSSSSSIGGGGVPRTTTTTTAREKRSTYELQREREANEKAEQDAEDEELRRELSEGRAEKRAQPEQQKSLAADNAARETTTPSVTVEDGPLHSRQPSLAFPPQQPQHRQLPPQFGSARQSPPTGADASAAPADAAAPVAASSGGSSPRGSATAGRDNDRRESVDSASSTGEPLLPSPSPDSAAAAAAGMDPAASPHDYSSTQSYTDALAFGDVGSRRSKLSLRQASSQAVDRDQEEELATELDETLFRQQQEDEDAESKGGEGQEEEDEAEKRAQQARLKQRINLEAIAAQREANQRALAASDEIDAEEEDDDEDLSGDRGFQLTDAGQLSGSSSQFELLGSRDLASSGGSGGEESKQQQPSAASRVAASPAPAPGARAYRGRHHETNLSLALSEHSSPSSSPPPAAAAKGAGSAVGLIQGSLMAASDPARQLGLGKSWERLGADGLVLGSSSSVSTGSLIPSLTFPPTLSSSSSSSGSLSRSQALENALSSRSVSAQTADRLVALLIEKEAEIYTKSRAMRELALHNAQRNQDTANLIHALEYSKLEYNNMLRDIRALAASRLDDIPRVGGGSGGGAARIQARQEFAPSDVLDVTRGPRAITKQQTEQYLQSVRAQPDSARQPAGATDQQHGFGSGSGSVLPLLHEQESHTQPSLSRTSSAASATSSSSASSQPASTLAHAASSPRSSLRSSGGASGRGVAFTGDSEQLDASATPMPSQEVPRPIARGSKPPQQQQYAEIHSARGYSSSELSGSGGGSGANSKASPVPPLNIPVVSLPMSAPPTSRDGAAEELPSPRRVSARRTAANPNTASTAGRAGAGTNLSAVEDEQGSAGEELDDDDLNERSQVWVDEEHQSEGEKEERRHAAEASSSDADQADHLAVPRDQHQPPHPLSPMEPPVWPGQARQGLWDTERGVDAKQTSSVGEHKEREHKSAEATGAATALSPEDLAREQARAQILQQWAAEDRQREEQRLKQQQEAAAAAAAAARAKEAEAAAQKQQQQQQPAVSSTHGSIDSSPSVPKRQYGPLPEDVPTLQSELVASRHEAERMRGLVLRLRADRVKLKQKVEALKQKLAHARGGMEQRSSSGAAHDDDGASSAASSVSATHHPSSSGRTHSVIQKLAQDMHDLRRKFKHEAKEWKQQRQGMEDEIRRLNERQPSSSSAAHFGGLSPPVSSMLGSPAHFAAWQQQQQQILQQQQANQYAGGSTSGEMLGMDDLYSGPMAAGGAVGEDPLLRRSAGRSRAAPEPIIHILPNSTLDDGSVGMGALASSTSAAASRRAPSHSPASSLSRAHAQSHARAQQQQQADQNAAAAAAAAAPAAAPSSSLGASGRSKSRGPASSSAYAQVGPRIRSDQFNAHLVSATPAGIDERAEEDHLRREAQRQAKKREKRELQKQQEMWEQQQQQEQRRIANLQLQRQQTLQEQFARYTHLQQLQQQQQQDALQSSLFSPAVAAPAPSPSSSLHASSAEGFDRRHRLPLANWSLEREVAWQNDRAEQARKEAAASSNTHHMTATIKVVETSDEKTGAGAAGRQCSPSPSRTQHRFIREEVREQERAKLFQQRYGEK